MHIEYASRIQGSTTEGKVALDCGPFDWELGIFKTTLQTDRMLVSCLRVGVRLGQGLGLGLSLGLGLC